jgi:hypothetical protein
MNKITNKISGIAWRYISIDAAAIRQGFGSFHSKDIEELISESNLSAPAIMKHMEDSVQVQAKQKLRNFEFGPKASSLFMIDAQWTFLNHGAFGAVLEPLMQASHLWRIECEKQPLKFFDRELFSLIAYSLQKVACYINCPANEIYPLQNVTTGLNIVLQSLHLEPGNEVICFSLTYGSTKKMLKDKCDRSGAVLRIVELPLPVASAEGVVAALSNALGDRTRLVIIDHITSNTAMVLPVLEMARVARAAGALVVVDAAHAMLSQPVSIYPPSTSTNPTGGENESAPQGLHLSDVADIWLTNGHKWLSAPKGCAFMWVHPCVAPHLRPAVVSHGFHPYCDVTPVDDSHVVGSITNTRDYSKLRWWHQGPDRSEHSPPAGRPVSKLLSSLVWDGCRDYTSLLCVPSALTLWQSIPAYDSRLSPFSGSIDESGVALTGVEAVRAYIRDLLHRQVVPMLQAEWGLNELDFAAPVSMRELSPMVLVRTLDLI